MELKFVDTNYFLRFLVGDNLEAYQLSLALFQKGLQGKVALVTNILVFFECAWVLSSFYGFKKEDLVKILDDLLLIGYIELQDRDLLRAALDLYKSSTVSLEDCFHIIYAKQRGANSIATFDKKLQKTFLLP